MASLARRVVPGIAPALRDPRLRVRIAQVVLLCAIAGAFYLVYRTTADNLARRGIATGFAFLWREAGFAIGEVVPVPVLAGPGAAFAAALLAAAAASALVRLLVGSAGAAAAPSRRIAGLLALACLGGAGLLALARGVRLDLVAYAADRSFAFALLTGFANTLKVSLVGCVIASVVGVLVGLARISTNLLVRTTAAVYVETLRNVPLLIQVFFWYFGVLRALPPVRSTIDLFGVAALNNRGVFLPRPEAAPGSLWFMGALALALLGAASLWRWAGRVQGRTGRRPPVTAVVVALVAGLPALAWIAAGAPVGFEIPVRRGFNFEGGLVVTPEFAALLLGLSLYTAAFIAEIVRSGLEGVSEGQREGARALGLREGMILRLVVFPQALRVMIPPLISQYLSLTKDSSLGIAIAYPELVSISNTMINQTGQPIEILTITIMVYMALNLLISLVINRFNEARRWSDR